MARRFKPGRGLLRGLLLLAGLAVLASAFVGWRLAARDTIAWTTLPATTCTPLDQLPAGRTFHVDPVRGSAEGDGSAARPFASLQALVDAGQVSARERALFSSELNLAAVMHRLPVPGTLDRPGALIGDGDTVLLAAGEYPALDLTRLVNRRFLTIAAAPGADVRLAGLRLGGASHFRFAGLTITGERHSQGRRYLVDTVGLHIAVRADNIVFDGVTFAGPAAIADTTPARFAVVAPSGLRLTGDCITVKDSRFADLHTAATLYRVRDATFAGNTIADFSVDGVQFSGQRIVIRDNLVYDHWPTGDDLHPDCMQGQPPDDLLFGPVLIEGNLCLARSSGELLPDAGWQGIAIFDGRWQDVTVRCNLVLPNSQHGIALYGMDGALVEHNVVAGQRNGRPSWIAIMPAKDGRQPQGVVVRHNRATAYINAVNGTADEAAAEAMRAALRVNGRDGVLSRRLRQPIDGVELQGNHWLVQADGGAPVPQDLRFTREEIAPVTFPISLEEARRRFPLPPECSRG